MELASSKTSPLVGVSVIIEGPRQVMDENFLVEMVKENTGGRSWESNPHVSISLTNGVLVVTQTAAAHGEVERLLSLLEQYR
jgi:hypothetical protein